MTTLIQDHLWYRFFDLWEEHDGRGWDGAGRSRNCSCRRCSGRTSRGRSYEKLFVKID